MLQNGDGVHSNQKKTNLNEPITHKEMMEMFAKAWANGTFK